MSSQEPKISETSPPDNAAVLGVLVLLNSRHDPSGDEDVTGGAVFHGRRSTAGVSKICFQLAVGRVPSFVDDVSGDTNRISGDAHPPTGELLGYTSNIKYVS